MARSNRSPTRLHRVRITQHTWLSRIALSCDGRSFDSRDENYYRHDTLPDRARSWGILGEDTSDDLIFLRDLRVTADYFEDMVHYDEASEAQAVANDLVAVLLRGRKR